MRYDVKKFLFVGLEEDRARFFQRAQDTGIIHFIDTKSSTDKISPSQGAPAAESGVGGIILAISDEPRVSAPKLSIDRKQKAVEATKALPHALQQIVQAIKVLRGLPVVEQDETKEYGVAEGLVNKILELKGKVDGLLEEERILKLEMARVDVFGDFSPEEVSYIEEKGHRKIQFYCAKRGYSEHTPLAPEVIYVGSDHGLDYFVAINKGITQYPKMVEMFIDRSYDTLKKRYDEVTKEIQKNEHDLKTYSKYNHFLHHAFVHQMNHSNLEMAKALVDFPLAEGNFFVVQGWVATHQLEKLSDLVNEFNVFDEEIDLDLNEVAPTYLENDGISRIGEDLVSIYDTPSNKDHDPSLWVLFFFALFFSMIIGDGGYGLVLLLIALYIRYKHSGLKGFKKRALNLFTILAFGCVAWGVLTTSFFGITIAPDNPVRRVSMMSWLVEKKTEYHIEHKDEVYREWVKKFPQLENVKNPETFLVEASKKNSHGGIDYEAYGKFSDNIMMELALFVGVLHIIISMARYVNRNWAQFGWILFLIGAYLYTPSFLGAASLVNFAFNISPATATQNGLYLMYVGFGIAVVVSVIQHKWLGLLEASVLIQIFGDVLSYLRLYALGLAGSLLTATMIDLAASVPVIFGIAILIFGHFVNIVLGIMGGVIHGLRLNFLEWYHYCFEGGGKMFKPLKKEEIE